MRKFVELTSKQCFALENIFICCCTNLLHAHGALVLALVRFACLHIVHAFVLTILYSEEKWLLDVNDITVYTGPISRK